MIRATRLMVVVEEGKFRFGDMERVVYPFGAFDIRCSFLLGL